jgi:DUF4097 and DUF4098 domain-containing protein YvlB
MQARLLLTLVLTALALAAPAGAAERMLELRLDEARPVQVENLVGSVRLIPGAEMVIRARVSAADPATAEQVRLLTTERNGALEVSVAYPAAVSRVRYEGEEFRRLDVTVEYLGRTMRVATGSGEPLRVDLEITVPADGELAVRQRIGAVSAERVRADLMLASRYGAVRVSDGAGRLRAATSSGAVEVSGFRGDVVADTGSGGVRIENVLGKVTADTGSGAVTLRGIDGDIAADTGSGRVRLHDVRGSLKVDTGSGSVRGEALVAGPGVVVSTGSGSVSLEGDLGAVRDLVARTGSGSITLRSDTPMSLDLHLSTGSGGIRVDVPDLGNVSAGRRSFRGVIGTGEGTARISTGSGSIRIGAR